MSKIRLDVDALEVHTFETSDAPPARGTVHAREYSFGDPSCVQACFPGTYEFETCYQTGPTCGASCDWGCNSIHVCPSDTGTCG